MGTPNNFEGSDFQKKNNPDKSYCTQRETSNGDLEIVLNDLPQGYSKVKVFDGKVFDGNFFK